MVSAKPKPQIVVPVVIGVSRVKAPQNESKREENCERRINMTMKRETIMKETTPSKKKNQKRKKKKNFT